MTATDVNDPQRPSLWQHQALGDDRGDGAGHVVQPVDEVVNLRFRLFIAAVLFRALARPHRIRQMSPAPVKGGL